MRTHTLFLATIALSTILTKNCSAMNNDTGTVTLINNGLLTTISGIVAQTSHGWPNYGGRYINSTSYKKDTLINLIHYQHTLDNAEGCNPIEIFCPLVFKDSYGTIVSLGQFNKNKHHEALKAIRQNKALYYASHQGALVYALDDLPNPHICRYFLNEQLEYAKNKIVNVYEES